MLWGTLGELPIAVVAALALRWLSARVQSAVGLIRDVIGATVPLRLTLPVAIPGYAASDQALLTSRMAWADMTSRAPPTSLPISQHFFRAPERGPVATRMFCEPLC